MILVSHRYLLLITLIMSLVLGLVFPVSAEYTPLNYPIIEAHQGETITITFDYRYDIGPNPAHDLWIEGYPIHFSHTWVTPTFLGDEISLGTSFSNVKVDITIPENILPGVRYAVISNSLYHNNERLYLEPYVIPFNVLPKKEEINVFVDIKPGSNPNSINIDSKGVLPIAILTTSDFDATEIDPTTVEVGKVEVSVKNNGTLMSSHEDVDEDGDLDLILQFDLQALALTPDVIELELIGKTFDETPIVGSDSVVFVPTK